MLSRVPPWQQPRIPPDVDRRLERVEAAAHEAVLQAHAELACDLVHVFAPRMAFDDAIERYLEIMDLDPDEAMAVRTAALSELGGSRLATEAWRDARRGRFDWKWATPLGALRLIRRKRERESEETYWLELSAARSEERLVRLHARYAARFVDLLDAHADPLRAVHLYLMRMQVPEVRARAVYQRVLARLAESLLPRLDDPADR